MHTVFVREHNTWAERLAKTERSLDGDALYERARVIVAAEIQAITYREFLPILLGPDALNAYEGYDPEVNPGIANVFSTAAFRVGHSLLTSPLLLSHRSGKPVRFGDVELADAFFKPELIVRDGVEPVLRGLAQQYAQRVDPYILEDVRNFLFGRPGLGGFDLAALNIQRGRDHGLPDYNRTRVDIGLDPVTEWSQITSDTRVVERLSEAYGTVDDVDLWIGGLAEDHEDGVLVGPTFRRIIARQFAALRDGDRFFYRNYLPADLADWVETQTLADIIRRNSRIGVELQADVFRVGPPAKPRATARQTTSAEIRGLKP